MAEKKTYYVTDKAGRFVAGVRRPESGRLELTAKQAEHELRLGNISETDPAEVNAAKTFTSQDGKITGDEVQLSDTTASPDDADPDAVVEADPKPAPRAAKAKR